MTRRWTGRAGAKAGTTLGLLAAALAAALFPGALFRGETFALYDLSALYRPAKALLAPLLRGSDGLPTWNPFLAAGQPWAANPQHELFHPATALFFVLPFETAFRLQVLLPPFVALAAFYFLLRTLHVTRPGAAFGALSWAFGGYLLSATNLLPVLFASAPLPAVLAFAVRAYRGEGARAAAGLAVSLGLTCLSGEPAAIAMLGVILPVALLASGPRSVSPGVRVRGLAVLFCGCLLGVLIASATLLPGARHAAKTARADGVAAEVALRWSMPPRRLAELLWPRASGFLERPGESRVEELYPGRHRAFLLSLHPGLAVTVLAAVGAFAARRRIWPWLALAGLGVLLAFGSHGPLWPGLRTLHPALSMLRYPERFALLALLPVHVVAAFGFDALVRRRGRVGAIAAFTGVAGLALLAAAAAGPGGGVLGRLALGPPLPWTEGVCTAVRTDLLRSAAVAALFAAAVLAFRRRGAPTSVIAFLAVASLDLASAGRPLVPTTPVAAVATPPRFLAPLAGRFEEGPLFHAAEYDAARSRARGLAPPPGPAQFGIPTALETDFDQTELRWSAEATAGVLGVLSAEPALAPHLLARRGIRAVLRFRPGAPKEIDDVRGAGLDGPLELVFLREPRPFAFAATRVARAADRAAWTSVLRSLGAEASTAVVLSPDAAPNLAARPSPAGVGILARLANRSDLAVDVAGPGDAALGVNQTWDTGWRATIDGRPVAVLRADLSLSAVVVPPGRHVVSLRHSDPWVSAGVALSLLGLLATAACAIAARVSGRRPACPRR